MISHEATPHPALAQHVALFWAMETRNAAATLERVLPSGTIELVFDLADPAQIPVVCGPHTGPFVMRRARSDSHVGIHFQPGGAAALLGVPASELVNLRVGLDQLWGAEARELGARLCGCATAEARLRLLESTLLTRLDRVRPAHPAVAFALDSLAHVPAPRSIGEIGADAGLSARRFIQVFCAQVGLTPKLYARVQRFQRLLQLAHPRAEPDWARLAMRCGYYDQAHLVRDFSAFAAVVPSAYLKLRSHDPFHIALAP